MLMQYLFAVYMLGVVIVGLLVMTRAISLEELGNGIWRGFLIAVIVLITLCVLKGLLLPILISWLVTLKHMISCVVIVVVAVIATMAFVRIAHFQT